MKLLFGSGSRDTTFSVAEVHTNPLGLSNAQAYPIGIIGGETQFVKQVEAPYSYNSFAAAGFKAWGENGDSSKGYADPNQYTAIVGTGSYGNAKGPRDNNGRDRIRLEFKDKTTGTTVDAKQVGRTPGSLITIFIVLSWMIIQQQILRFALLLNPKHQLLQPT